MIVVDTSIWIDFLRGRAAELERLLPAPAVLCYPMIVGELACGNLPDRAFAPRRLRNLPRARVVEDAVLLDFIEQRRLFDRGIGFVDAHLLASTLVDDARRLWTRDRRLHAIASELGVAYDPPGAREIDR